MRTASTPAPAAPLPAFDDGGYLQLAQRHRATHTMLVPVQHQRIMARPDFGACDLSAFRPELREQYVAEGAAKTP